MILSLSYMNFAVIKCKISSSGSLPIFFKPREFVGEQEGAVITAFARPPDFFILFPTIQNNDERRHGLRHPPPENEATSNLTGAAYARLDLAYRYDASIILKFGKSAYRGFC